MASSSSHRAIRNANRSLGHRSGSSISVAMSDIANGAAVFIKSHSTAEIGVDKARDEKRERQMREILRHFAQPRKYQPLTGKELRRKQVDAIYAYIQAHGLPQVPASISASLEEYVTDNKRYLAWIPTVPQYFVVCEPTPEANETTVAAAAPQGLLPSGSSRDRITISMHSPNSKFAFGEDLFDPLQASVGTGQPQGFLASLGEDMFPPSTMATGKPQGFLEAFGEEYASGLAPPDPFDFPNFNVGVTRS